MRFLSKLRNKYFICKSFVLTECNLKYMVLGYRCASQNRLLRKPIRVLTNSAEPSKIISVGERVLGARISANEKGLVEVTEEKKAVIPAPRKKKAVKVPAYVKLSEADDRYIKILTTLKSRNLREKSGKILLEGKRLINDAIAAGAELKTLFFSREETLAEINLEQSSQVELYKVLYKKMQVWSGVVTCPGIMGVFKQPTYEQINILTDPVLPVTVLCDNIRDPGNMGSVIRNAAAAGCRAVLLTKGCVDPWEQKVLRTGMGAHFRVPVINNISWEHVINYLPRTSALYLADNSEDVDPFDSEIRNEVNFLEKDEKGDTEERHICQTEDEMGETEDGEEEDGVEGSHVCQTEEGETLLVDKTYTAETDLEEFNDVYLPCHLYSSIKYPKDDIVLYIGGETHGLSPQANKLACEFDGRRVKIPLENGVESLNSSFALAIILYEIKRQLGETYVTKFQ